MTCATLILTLSCVLSSSFDDAFTGETLRFDYYHSGTATEEHIGLDRIRLEGDWPGSRARLIDDTNLGKYLFVVLDVQTNRQLYSRGFCSIFGEWQTIAEARRGTWRTFHESQRFPEPKDKCQLVLKKRGNDGSFTEIFSTVVDPQSRFVHRAPLNRRGEVWSVFENGSPATKVDLLVLGDGYAGDEMEKYRADVKRLVGGLFETEPFRSQKGSFNVWAIDVAAERSGITHSRAGQWNETPLGMTSNAFDLERYVLTYDNLAIREIAALAPYDALALVANTRKYGGGGIFNLWSTCALDSSQSEFVFVHEFGHSFAGLADEYYTSQVAYEEFTPPGVEPWEPNITALLDPDRLKWKDLVDPTTPIPTPWKQEHYDQASHKYQAKRNELREANASEEKLDELFDEVKAETTPILSNGDHAGKVGAFEGAGYRAQGLYRPEVDCLMFTRNPESFCRVCSRAIEKIIRLYAE